MLWHQATISVLSRYLSKDVLDILNAFYIIDLFQPIYHFIRII